MHELIIGGPLIDYDLLNNMKKLLVIQMYLDFDIVAFC